MKHSIGSCLRSVCWLVLLAPLSVGAAPQGAPQTEENAKPAPKVRSQIHPTDSALWKSLDRTQVERREKFLQEIRKLYPNEEGPGI